MEKGGFKFRIHDISSGWCNAGLSLNGKSLHFNASYIGANPMASLIDACAGLTDGAEQYCLRWEKEPGTLYIELNLAGRDRLDICISDCGVCGTDRHGEVLLGDFVRVVADEGFRVLNAFGLEGYRCSWQDGTEFPLTALLRIANYCEGIRSNRSCCTDILEETVCLQKMISRRKITEKTIMERCTVYYEAWQLQCCGLDFSVGETVEWYCIMPQNYKNAHGIIIDMEEEHLGDETHSLTGTVTRIFAEYGFCGGKPRIGYHDMATWTEELQHADGWECDIDADGKNRKNLKGYIVELEDAIIEPLEEDKSEKVF